MKKYKIVSVILTIILFSFCCLSFGCNASGVVFKGATSTKTSQAYYLKFEYMDGTDSHALSLKSGDVLDVRFEKEEGVFSVVIGIDGEDYAYKTDDGGNMNFKLNIVKDGKYKITVTSKKAKGVIDIKKVKS